MTGKVFTAVFWVITGLAAAKNVPGVSQKDPARKWVDSVYNSLTEEERILQLLFRITHSARIEDSGIGGVILTGQENITGFGRPDQLSPLLGSLFDESVYHHSLGIDWKVVAASNDPALIRESATYSARDAAHNFDFLFVPHYSQLKLHDDPASNHQLSLAFHEGLGDSKIPLWSSGSQTGANDQMRGVDLRSVLNNRLPGDLKKREIRKMLRDRSSSEIVYYRTGINEPNLEEAAALSDVLLFEGDPAFYLSTMYSALKSRKIKKRHLERRVRKVLAAKYNIEKKEVGGVRADQVLQKKMLVWKIRQNSIVLLNNTEEVIPVKRIDDRGFASLSLGPFENEPFQSGLDRYTFFSHYDESHYLQDQHRLKKILAHYDYVVVGFSFPGYADLANADVISRVRFLEELSTETNVVIIVFAGLKWLEHFTSSKTLMMAFDESRDVQSIVPQIIFGALPAGGKLPVGVSSLAAGTGQFSDKISRLSYSFPENQGFDPLMEKKIDYIVSMAIDSAATPGCQVLVARNGEVVLEKAYGHYTYDSIQGVTTGTLYDLASVTKVASTLQVSMFLEGLKAFNLDDPISKYLIELVGTNKENLEIRKILAHQAGLQSYYPFYQKTLTGDRLNSSYYSSNEESIFNQQVAPGIYGHSALEDSLWNWTIQSALRKLPEGGEHYDYSYSDLGFFTLQKLNERLINQPMEDFLSQNFYDPLGMSHTCYLPLCRFPLDKIAPTEIDYDFRNSLIWGTVHDENAALTGGVGGHAGLFSTANDLAILMQMNLQDGYYGGVRYLQMGTVPKFSEKQFPGNRRGLGWDKPSFYGSYSNTSRYSSRSTFGHLGFTGTAVWVDPEYQLIYIFLSNRVHPNRENDKLMVENIRSRIHEVIYDSMPEFKSGS